VFNANPLQRFKYLMTYDNLEGGKNMIRQLFGIFICMLLIITVLPASGNIDVSNNLIPLSSGKTLFVGGSGPGNYSTIQEAIDDSSDGDKIFVFDDSSPYIENIIVDKSIDLIGENKDTTIIEGSDVDSIVLITENNVTFSGFTIQNSLYDGIIIVQDENPPWNNEIYNVNVFDNNIKNVSRGIFGLTLSDSEIFNNNIKDSVAGIYLCQSSNSNVSGNYISDCEYRGIEINAFRSEHYIVDRILNRLSPPAENNIVYRNTLEHNRWGIDIGSDCTKTKVIENNIINNFEVGIQLQSSSNIEIKRNNFIETENYLEYTPAKFSAVNRYKQYFTNSWDANYWDEPMDKPVPINGIFYFYILIPIGLKGGIEFEIYHHSLVTYDRHPAQEPYDIKK